MKNSIKSIPILVSLFFTNSILSTAQKYDVEVILSSIKCLKVVEFIGDSQEDIFGFIAIGCYVMPHQADANVLVRYGTYAGNPSFYNNKPNTNDTYDFFNRTRSGPLRIQQGQVINSGAYQKFTGINYAQLIGFEFLLGGSISDDEPLAVRYQNCTTCTYVQNSLTAYRLVRMSSYKSQIDAMAANTNKFLTIGQDNIMELNFYEGDSNSSHIRFNFKIKVSKK